VGYIAESLTCLADSFGSHDNHLAGTRSEGLLHRAPRFFVNIPS
jgi:hypothetical protein